MQTFCLKMSKTLVGIVSHNEFHALIKWSKTCCRKKGHSFNQLGVLSVIISTDSVIVLQGKWNLYMQYPIHFYDGNLIFLFNQYHTYQQGFDLFTGTKPLAVCCC